jgi:transposase InsO family protein
METAFANRKAQDGLIFHSDRGVPYWAKSFRRRLEELCPSVRWSKSRKGNCWDKAWAETLFKTLKGERENLDGNHSAEDVRQSVFMYIGHSIIVFVCIRRLTMLPLMSLPVGKPLNSVYPTG